MKQNIVSVFFVGVVVVEQIMTGEAMFIQNVNFGDQL